MATTTTCVVIGGGDSHRCPDCNRGASPECATLSPRSLHCILDRWESLSSRCCQSTLPNAATIRVDYRPCNRIVTGAPISRPGLSLGAIQTQAFEFVGRLTGEGQLRRVGRRLIQRASQLSWFGEGQSTPHIGDGCHVPRATNFAMPFTPEGLFR